MPNMLSTMTKGRTLLRRGVLQQTQPTCIDRGTGVDVTMLLISDTQVRTVFEKLRAEDPAMWHVVDASMSLDDVTAKVFAFPANARSFLRRLQFGHMRVRSCARLGTAHSGLACLACDWPRLGCGDRSDL